MVKPSQQVLEALARIPHQEPVFLEWLAQRLEFVSRASIQERDEVLSRWSQGRAQELVDILDTIQQAREVLGKRRA